MRVGLPMNLLVVAMVLAACDTPAPVRNLAKLTAANTAQLDAQIKEFTSRQTVIGETRANNIVAFERRQGMYKADRAVDAAVLDASGQSAPSALFNKLKRLSEVRKAEADAQQTAIDQLAKGLADARTKFALPSEQLAATSKLLAQLAEEMEAEDHLKFLIQFGKTVAKDVEEAKKAAEKDKSEGSAQQPTVPK